MSHTGISKMRNVPEGTGVQTDWLSLVLGLAEFQCSLGSWCPLEAGYEPGTQENGLSHREKCGCHECSGGSLSHARGGGDIAQAGPCHKGQRACVPPPKLAEVETMNGGHLSLELHVLGGQ